MLGPGLQLADRYRLDERIGAGGMGEVWRGTDEVLGRTIAVKIMLPALLEEPGFAERFRGEARTMATVNHPGVVDVYDYRSDSSLAFLVMEYVEGDPLSRTLSRVGRLTAPRTMALIAQAADALHAAHEKGIVHRDVKPGNLLVRPNGTLVLTDFGIARSGMVGQLTATGAVLGTASYLSPEQAAGQVATPVSDLYALGVVAYQCLAGRRPFEGESPIEIAMKHVREQPPPLPADIPPAVRAIVERTLAKDPSARWPSAAILAAVARQTAATLAAASVPAAPKPVSPSSPGVPTVPGPPGAAPASPGTPGTRAAPASPTAPASPGGAHLLAPQSPSHSSPGAPPGGSGVPAGGSGVPASYRPGSAAVPGQPAAPHHGHLPVDPAYRPGPGAGHHPAAPRPQPAGSARPPTARPSGLVIAAVILGVLAILLCAGLAGLLARQLVERTQNGPGAHPFTASDHTAMIEGPTTR